MAGFTTDTHIYVSRVIEIGIIWEHMNTDPLDGFSCLPALPDEFQIFIICFNLIVAVHTGLSGGDIGMSGVENLSVTILSIHSELASVGFVAVRDRLLRWVSCVTVFRRTEITSTKNQSIETKYKT